MACTSTRDDGDLRLGSIWAEIDDSVFGVEGSRRVRVCHAFECGQDKVVWVVDEVLGCSQCAISNSSGFDRAAWSILKHLHDMMQTVFERKKDGAVV